MVIDRRAALMGLAATAAAPRLALAHGYEPALLSALKDEKGYAFGALSEDGELLFRIPLPKRGHGMAVAPDGASAVAFARRPGEFAIAIDLKRGVATHHFAPPADRRFNGHGLFSADGRRLFTTENDFDGERGVLGVYDASADFRRLGEIDLGGVGPHEAIALRDGRTIAVAIGGIATHPDFPRAKLNLPEMKPGLALLDIETGDIVDHAEAEPALHKVSIRHLCEDGSGALWFGGQDEGAVNPETPLIGRYRRDGKIEMLDAPELNGPLAGYVGSIAASRDGARIAATSPRGGVATIIDAVSGAVVETRTLPDVCGAGAFSRGFVFSDGSGNIDLPRRRRIEIEAQWDNHLSTANSQI